MPDMSDYDVAIVGASLGGCTAATFLGRQGAKVALIESHSDPAAFKRMCTHFIQASASPTIDRLGIGEALREARARQTDTNIWTRYGWISFGRDACTASVPSAVRGAIHTSPRRIWKASLGRIARRLMKLRFQLSG